MGCMTSLLMTMRMRSLTSWADGLSGPSVRRFCAIVCDDGAIWKEPSLEVRSRNVLFLGVLV
jgi:hypothetical protein